jgi:hypothetical protein
MSRLKPEKLFVKYLFDANSKGPVTPRRYTLTHSDVTGDLFLSVGGDYDRKSTSGFYTRFMRDEVLAEWCEDENGFSFHVYCHVSGGIVLGRAGWRLSIFRHEMPLVLEAIRYGDKEFFTEHPDLDNSPVIVHFKSSKDKYNRIEEWGALRDYRQK